MITLMIRRMIAGLMKWRVTSGKTLPPGFKLPKESAAFLPSPGTSKPR